MLLCCFIRTESRTLLLCYCLHQLYQEIHGAWLQSIAKIRLLVVITATETRSAMEARAIGLLSVGALGIVRNDLV